MTMPRLTDAQLAILILLKNNHEMILFNGNFRLVERDNNQKVSGTISVRWPAARILIDRYLIERIPEGQGNPEWGTWYQYRLTAAGIQAIEATP